eukprot:CAMPEP_0201589990 /NCGR_PEP_ID=MMETSP0190_2-20130828/172930_1 /ASSEMBLY_ACC=CAM_ASM_000263 /TAXON_ID=37353 /ORGANISM="Rosalina sp." /LENGTH=81 /DNA_ID=CAMNT_0048045239 /DNA_START=55 /DNA_END=300 /DNA_ORIENTATION=-
MAPVAPTTAEPTAPTSDPTTAEPTSPTEPPTTAAPTMETESPTKGPSAGPTEKSVQQSGAFGLDIASVFFVGLIFVYRFVQ